MTQNEELDKIFFVTFCMGQYKHEHNMTGKEVADLFSQQGALTYLEENFEILHTQSRQWLMEEINHQGGTSMNLEVTDNNLYLFLPGKIARMIQICPVTLLPF